MTFKQPTMCSISWMVSFHMSRRTSCLCRKSMDEIVCRRGHIDIISRWKDYFVHHFRQCVYASINDLNLWVIFSIFIDTYIFWNQHRESLLLEVLTNRVLSYMKILVILWLVPRHLRKTVYACLSVHNGWTKFLGANLLEKSIANKLMVD
mgnify:CR=1 FL=1